MKIFISYRRDDSAGYAGRLFDYLAAHFGEQNVFMDIDTIEPGEDFRRVVQTAVGTCDVVLVMIGKQWLSIRDSQGHRRLEDPRDWVRMEIADALVNPKVRVIPVLVREAEMPGVHELPTDLKELSWRNAIELSDTRFQHDVNKLIGVMERVVSKSPAPPVGRQFKNTSPRFWGLLAGLGGLGVFVCFSGYIVYRLVVFRPATGDSGVTATVTPAPTWTSPPSTASPSPTSPPPTVTFTPVRVLSPGVQVLEHFFRGINDATSIDEIASAWNLMTLNFQCNPSDKCMFGNFRDHWWQRRIVYEIFECEEPYQAVARYSAVSRSQPSLILDDELYEIYYIVNDNGVLKINKGTLISAAENTCTPIGMTSQ